MPTETTARADQQSDAPDESDYQAFCEALSASARGRAFLAEYTRRNRNADTEQLLAAIERLQSLVTSNATPPSEAAKPELRALLDEIDAAQREFEASVLAIKAGKLAELIALVERRISKILASPREDTLKNETPIPEPDLPHEPDKQVERSHLAVDSRNCRSLRPLPRSRRQSLSCAPDHAGGRLRRAPACTPSPAFE